MVLTTNITRICNSQSIFTTLSPTRKILTCSNEVTYSKKLFSTLRIFHGQKWPRLPGYSICHVADCDRLEGRHPKTGAAGHNTLLTRPEELAVGRYIDRLDNVGLAVHKEFVRDAANPILRLNKSIRPYMVMSRRPI